MAIYLLLQRFLNLNSFKPHLMRKRIFFMAFFGLQLLSPACALADGAPTIRWDFDTLDGWVYEHQDQAPAPQCSLSNGNLYIYTRAYTRDRQKMHTTQQVFTCGRYSWRTYISPIATGEQTSIGSWIYCDEQHELDFEVGPGTADVRRKYGIGEGELAACMTSQANPFVSSYAAVRAGWHVFTIELENVQGRYLARWYIDGEEKQRLPLHYGDEKAFRIYCSVENLTFIGDHIPSHQNYALFDWVEFTGTSGTANGISHAGAGRQKPAAVYNLQGIRVAHPRKGNIYVINKKKVIY